MKVAMGTRLVLVLGLIVLMVLAVPAAAVPNEAADDSQAWTRGRMAQAIPRDLVIDERGLGYLRRPDGSLQPHGHGVPAQDPGGQRAPEPAGNQSGPGSGGGTTASFTVTHTSPAQGVTVAASSHTFTAQVTATLGVRSVQFVITNGTTRTVTAAAAGGNTWSANVTGLVNGAGNWHVIVKDNGKRGGSTFTSQSTGFTVALPAGGVTNETVTNAAWSYGGAVQTAAGRIYFEMPNSAGAWAGYVCSGTVATDGTTGRSIILTAAHCVYDDVAKVFARNVIFIPNQADGTDRTDRDCTNDPLGCWSASQGVVDVNWTTRVFPANIPWDYAYYVVEDAGAHQGTAAPSDSLDAAAGSLTIQFTAPRAGDYTHALGYSYSEDPKFMFCAQGLATESSYIDWWLGKCGLSGGSSGGPWVQPMDRSTGSGPVISVNSWGYTNQPGMGGPKLNGTSAACVFGVAKTSTANAQRGTVTTC